MRLITNNLITKEDYKTDVELKSYIEANKHTPYYVYFLIDPTTYQIKYIGKGSGHRALSHWVYDQHKNPKKQSWLNKLDKRGLKPLYAIWEFYNDEQQAYQQENNLIYIMGRKQLDKKGTLLNLVMDLGGGIKNRLKTTKQFIKEVEAIHGRDVWDFTKTKYVYAHERVTVICKKCKTEYEKHPSNLLNKEVKRCLNCWAKQNGENNSHSTAYIKYQTERIFNGILEITSELYLKNNRKFVDINCRVCNTKVSKRVDSLLQGSGCSKRCHLGLSPQRASELVGLSPYVLKRKLAPDIITGGGHKRYSFKQLETLK